MAKNLWDLSGEQVGDSELYFRKWDEFLQEQPLVHLFVQSRTPIKYTWYKYSLDDSMCNINPKYRNSTKGLLSLIYLSLNPLKVKCIAVEVHDEDQPKVRRWWVEHDFLPGDDV